MVEKKKSEAAAKPAAKKTTRRTSVKKEAASLVVNAESAGFRAGDVYQALAAAGKPLSAKEIAKAAGISEAEVYVGIGWLFKEGKILSAEDKIALA